MRVFTAVIAIATGVLILFGYFFESFALVQSLLLNWAIILASVAALVGIFNLTVVHMDKIRRGEKGGIYSALLVIGLVGTLGFCILLRPQHSAMQMVLNGIIIPAEAALL